MDVSLNGADIIVINGRNLRNFADKDYGVLNFPNENATMKVGKNSNVVIAAVPAGQMAELTLRTLAATTDDAFLNSIQRAFQIDAPSFPLVVGQVVKRIGDGQGNIRPVVYNLEAGVPTKVPESKSNADGDEEQGISVWTFKFGRGTRQLL